MNETDRNAVIYCRVSTKEQVEEGNSLKTQEKICIEYAQKNGYNVSKIFIEQGESAKTADRPVLQEMLKFCSMRSNKILAVIVYKIDRISRNTDDYSSIRILLKKYGVEIKSTSEMFENNPVGRFIENTMASIAELDNSIRAERSTNGMKEAVREGRYVWKAPIGYVNSRLDGKSNIVPGPLAPLVLELFIKLAKGGVPSEVIRRELHIKGLCGFNGQPLAKGYFYRLIKNSLYKGQIEMFGEIHQGVFTPIVPEEIFDLVQYKLSMRTRKSLLYKIDNEDFPLRRFIRYEDGSKLRGSWSVGRNGNKYAFYRFEGKRGLNFRKDSMELIFVRFLNLFSLHKEAVTQLIRVLQEAYSQTIKRTKDVEKEVQQRISMIRKKMEALIDKSISGIIPDDLVKSQIVKLKQEEMELTSRMLDFDINDPKLDIKNITAMITVFAENPGAIWKNLPLTEKLRLQSFLFPEGLIFNGEQLRTTKTALIFRLREQFIDLQSPLVNQQLLDTKQIFTELQNLYIILHGKD